MITSKRPASASTVVRQALGEVGLDDGQSRMPVQVGEVLLGAGDEVVDGDHGGAASEHCLDDMRRDKPGTAGDQDPAPLAKPLHDRHAVKPIRRFRCVAAAASAYRPR